MNAPAASLTPEWPILPPAEMGLAPEALAAAGRALSRPPGAVTAFVVVRRGALVWEQFFPHTRQHLFSLTKSVISMLYGIALRHGLFQSLEQPLADFFPDQPQLTAGRYPPLTLRHLLTMTCGWNWPVRSYGLELMFDRLRRSPDWTRFILSLPVHTDQIGVFHYCSAASHLLSVILGRTAGSSARAYANQHLFAPLGIAPLAEEQWPADPQGNTLGGWGLHLSGREVARLGLLYLRRGQWQGQAIVSPAWVDESTHLPPQAGPAGYGYQWWLRATPYGPVFAGLGRGGQYLFCAPRQDLLAVILSRPASRWPDRWDVFLPLLASAAVISRPS